MKEDLMDNISIIIRNRNESEYIGFAIQSCIEKFNKPQIIVVNNNSTDDSLEIVNLFNNRANIEIIECDNYSPGRSINLGVKKSVNNTILILSAHAQIIDVNLPLIESDLKNHIAVFGKQIPIYRGKKITPRYIWSHFSDEKSINLFSDIENRYFFHNAFSFFKKTTLEKFPFDEKIPGKEDRYWAIDRINEGNEILYNPEYKAFHFYTKNGATWKGIG
jgi:glycosyltransferase involved in cell wall biosynthesis